MPERKRIDAHRSGPDLEGAVRVRVRMTPRWWVSVDDVRIGKAIRQIWTRWPGAQVRLDREKLVVAVDLAPDATVKDYVAVRSSLRAEIEAIGEAGRR